MPDTYCPNLIKFTPLTAMSQLELSDEIPLPVT